MRLSLTESVHDNLNILFAQILWHTWMNINSCQIDNMHSGVCVCYHEIKDTEDTVKLQEDTDRLGCWATRWGMRFQPVKCKIMQITRKRNKKDQCFL